MRYTLTMAATIGILLSSYVSPRAYTVGDWVLGQFQGRDYWFPGVIGDVSKGKVTIRYDDGDLETLILDHVKPYDWQIGSSVECNFKSSGRWYAGKITGLSGSHLSIAYNDGDKEHTKTGLCRSR